MSDPPGKTLKWTKKKTIVVGAISLAAIAATATGVVLAINSKNGGSSTKGESSDGLGLETSSAGPSVSPSLWTAPSFLPSRQLSGIPSELPTTALPSLVPTYVPSVVPSQGPTAEATQIPTTLPTEAPTRRPTEEPTLEQTGIPTRSPRPTTTLRPSMNPTPEPTRRPTKEPTSTPTYSPTESPRPTKANDFETTFYVIADVPYNDRQKVAFPDLVAAVGPGAFQIHMGDIKSGKDKRCLQEDYDDVAAVLSESLLPVFLVVGDNEFNDCNNPDGALQQWRQSFSRFDTKHWNHDLSVTTMPGRSESFTFVTAGTLYFGLNIVGGAIHNRGEWEERLTSQYTWVTGVIDRNQVQRNPARAIVIFGHATPDGDRRSRFFFNPLRGYLRNVLENRIPVLYVSGDKHSYQYESSFLNQPNVLRVTAEGGTKNEPLRVSVDTNMNNVRDAVTVDREWNSQYVGAD